MDFAIEGGNTSAASSWKVEILDGDGTSARSFSGRDSKVPAVLAWDGRSADKGYSGDGTCAARLNLDYGYRFSGMVLVSRPFVLALTPPHAAITLSISAPGLGTCIGCKGSWPAKAVTWNGRGVDRSIVESASDHGFVTKVKDGFGTVGEARSTIWTGIMVIKTALGDASASRASCSSPSRWTGRASCPTAPSGTSGPTTSSP